MDTKIFNLNTDKLPNSESPNPDSGQAANICAPSTYPTLNISNSDALAGTDLEFTINTIGSENLCDIEFNWKIETTDIIGAPAQLGVDYNASLTGTASIPKGTTSVTIIVSTVNDNRKNGTKEFHLKITDLEKAKFLGDELETSVLGSILDVNPICNNLADIGNDNYGGGSGTNEDPYLICTTPQFNKIGATSSDWDKHFLQTADIDLATLNTNNYNRIGNVTTPFTGQFDGGNFEIKNLTFTSSAPGEAIALFKEVGTSKFSNINMVNFNLTSAGDVSGLVGNAIASSIVEITKVKLSESNIEGPQNIGSLVSKSDGSIVCSFCQSDEVEFLSSEFNSGNGLGGLIGNVAHASISNSNIKKLNITNTSLTLNFGGLVGNVGILNILNSNVSELTIGPGAQRSGGLVGTVDTGVIRDSFVKDSSLILSNFSGGLVGVNTTYLFIENSHLRTTQINGASDAGGIVGVADGNVILTQVSFLGHFTSLGPRSGGFIGSQTTGVTYKTINISNSYIHLQTGRIGTTTSANAGGVMGLLQADNTIIIKNVYISGEVRSSGTARGCIRGANLGFWNISNTYFNSTACTIGAAPSGGSITGASGLTDTQMRNPTNFLEANGWLSTIWKFVNGHFPKFLWEQVEPPTG